MLKNLQEIVDLSHCTSLDARDNTIIAAPIINVLLDDPYEGNLTKREDDNEEPLKTQSFYLGMNLVQPDITMDFFRADDIKQYGTAVGVLLVFIIFSICCVFQVSHTVIRPLRVLNSRMMEIIESDNL